MNACCHTEITLFFKLSIWKQGHEGRTISVWNEKLRDMFRMASTSKLVCLNQSDVLAVIIFVDE